jgi:peptide/nickel transport system permease protein
MSEYVGPEKVHSVRHGQLRDDRTPARRPRGALRIALGRAARTPRGLVGLSLATSVFFVAFVGPALGMDPLAFIGPAFTQGGESGLLGTDVLGRSVTARVFSGGRDILLLALVATLISVCVGAALGVVAAYSEGWLDLFLMRTVDVFLVIPQLVFALLLISISNTSQALVIIAVAVTQAPQVARVIYGSAQSVCERDFVKAVALWGVPRRRVIMGQVLPNLVTPLAVEAGLRLSFSIIIISGLNFLGFGVTPPDPNWGVMINENRIGLGVNPWGVLVPAALLGTLAVGINLFTDATARVSFGDTGASELEVSSILHGEQT